MTSFRIPSREEFVEKAREEGLTIKPGSFSQDPQNPTGACAELEPNDWNYTFLIWSQHIGGWGLTTKTGNKDHPISTNSIQ